MLPSCSQVVRIHCRCQRWIFIIFGKERERGSLACRFRNFTAPLQGLTDRKRSRSGRTGRTPVECVAIVSTMPETTAGPRLSIRPCIRVVSRGSEPEQPALASDTCRIFISMLHRRTSSSCWVGSVRSVQVSHKNKVVVPFRQRSSSRINPSPWDQSHAGKSKSLSCAHTAADSTSGQPFPADLDEGDPDHRSTPQPPSLEERLRSTPPTEAAMRQVQSTTGSRLVVKWLSPPAADAVCGKKRAQTGNKAVE